MCIRPSARFLHIKHVLVMQCFCQTRIVVSTNGPPAPPLASRLGALYLLVQGNLADPFLFASLVLLLLLVRASSSSSFSTAAAAARTRARTDTQLAKLLTHQLSELQHSGGAATKRRHEQTALPPAAWQGQGRVRQALPRRFLKESKAVRRAASLDKNKTLRWSGEWRREGFAFVSPL